MTLRSGNGLGIFFRRAWDRECMRIDSYDQPGKKKSRDFSSTTTLGDPESPEKVKSVLTARSG